MKYQIFQAQYEVRSTKDEIWTEQELADQILSGVDECWGDAVNEYDNFEIAKKSAKELTSKPYWSPTNTGGVITGNYAVVAEVDDQGEIISENYYFAA